MTAPHEGARVYYEIELAVDLDAAKAIEAWLPAHIRDVLTSEGFLGAEWYDLDSDSDAVRWCVRYTVRDRTSLEAYFAGPAVALRAEGMARFGGRFKATRRVFSVREVIRQERD